MGSVFVAFSASALLLTTTAGCSKCGGSSGELQGDAAINLKSGVGSLTEEQQGRVLAKVGKHNITLGEFAAVLERMDQFERLRYQSAERRKELLDEMINVELLAQEAMDKGYDKDPLAQQEARAILRDAVLSDLRKEAPKPTEIPEADARKYFADHRADYKDPERRRTSVLVTRDAATAEKLLKELSTKSTAAQFGTLVREQSVDPSAKANIPLDLLGDLGIAGPPGDPRGDNVHIPEPIRVALFQIAEVGGYADKPIAAEGRFYIVRLSQRLDARERSFEEAERVIRVKLAQEALIARERQLVESLRKQFPVQVDEAALQGVAVQLASQATLDGGAGDARATVAPTATVGPSATTTASGAVHGPH